MPSVVGGSIRLQLPPGSSPTLCGMCRGLLGENAPEGIARVCRGEYIPTGGNMLIAHEVFNSIALFDTAMTHGGCDTEIVGRAVASGITVAIAPAAIVHHVIPPYRLTSSYFRWAATRAGCQLAYRDCKKCGRARMFLVCVARAGQVILVNLPLLILSLSMGNSSQSLYRRCLLWRANGYVRQAASIAIRSKGGLLTSRLEFRKERTSFQHVAEQ